MDLRVLAVRPGPQFSVQDVHNGWVRALQRLGVTTVDFPYDTHLNFIEQSTAGAGLAAHEKIRMASKSIEAALYEVWPHVVLVTMGKFIPPELYLLMRERRHKVVLLLTESPYEDAEQVNMAAYADVVLVNDPANLEQFRQINPNTFYQPHGYDPHVHTPGPADPDLSCDLTFVGSGFPSRARFLQAALRGGWNVKLAGNWLDSADTPLADLVVHPLAHCCDNTDAVRLYRSAKASLNLYRKETTVRSTAAGWAAGPREVEMAACGLFFLREPRGEGDDLWPMLPTFDGPDDFADQLGWWLRHPDLRADAARKAREASASRTFDNHAAALLRRLYGG